MEGLELPVFSLMAKFKLQTTFKRIHGKWNSLHKILLKNFTHSLNYFTYSSHFLRILTGFIRRHGRESKAGFGPPHRSYELHRRSRSKERLVDQFYTRSRRREKRCHQFVLRRLKLVLEQDAVYLSTIIP